MKAYAKKVGKTLLFGLVILAIAAVVWLVVPKYQNISKYQIYTIRVDDDLSDLFDNVLIIKLNTITGETDSWYKQYDPNPSRIKKIKLID